MDFRKRVTLFSFILTVIVIWVHAVDPKLMSLMQGAGEITDSSVRLCYHIQMILGTYLGQLAVPGFFCMSGYLFFRNLGHAGKVSVGRGHAGKVSAVTIPEMSGRACLYTDEMKDTMGQIGRKLRSRVRTLVLPFLIWNIIYYLIYIAAGRTEFTVSELLPAVFINKYNPVFWYMRELIIINLLTPLILLFIRYRSGAIVTLLITYAAAICYERLPIHIVNEDALFYYICGAAAAVHLRRFIESFAGAARPAGYTENAAGTAAHAAGFMGNVPTEKMRKNVLTEKKRKKDAAENPGSGSSRSPRVGYAGVSALELIIYLISLYLVYSGRYGKSAVLAAAVGGRICGVAAIYAMLCLITFRADPELPRFMHYNFLIYAVHYLEIRFFRMIMNGAGLSLGFTRSIGFIIMPLLSVAAAVILGNVIKKISPALYVLVTGGRN